MTQKIEDALRFYSDKSNYIRKDQHLDTPNGEQVFQRSEVEMDKGFRASMALQTLRGDNPWAIHFAL